MDTNDYITIEISKTGKYSGKYEALVSKKDSDLQELSWHLVGSDKKRRTLYATRNQQIAPKKRTHQLMHRLIMERILGRKLNRNEHIDHINNNGLDNRRENLRLCNPVLNSGNQRKANNNTSGYKGVTRRNSGRYRARIFKDGIKYDLGSFDTPEDAHKAYCEKAKELYGEYANFGDD